MGRSMEEILNNPTIVIDDILTDMESELNGNIIAKEFTSPFHNLLEGSRSLAVDSLVGSSNIIRKKFPSLATTMEDLFFNVHDEVKDNLFAIGGTAPIIFYLNVIDLRQYGIKENDSFIVTIPSGSTITALSTTFTLLNDITVTLKENNTVTVEQKNNDLDIAINNLGILSSNFYTDEDGIEWIIFETKVKNIIKTTKVVPINHTGNLSVDIPIQFKYSTITVSYQINDTIYPISVSYSDVYLNENQATALVVLKDKSVNVTIPKKYLIDKEVTGKLIIDVYETEGEKNLDLSKLRLEDFSLALNNTGLDIYKSVSKNIIMLNNSRGVLNNGVDSMTFDELKHAVINSTLGDIDVPITSYQIKRKAKMSGYELNILKDTLFERLFIANKSLPIVDTTMIASRPDVFFNNASILLSEDNLNRNIELYKDLFIIKSGTTFKYDNNGLINILDDVENDFINGLNNANKILYLKENKIFYTPLTYVVKYDSDITSSEVYYLNPTMENIRITDKNNNILERVNTSKFGIFKTIKGYNIKTMIVYNDELKTRDLTKLKARLVFDIYNTDSKIHYDADYNVETGMFDFNIDTGYMYNNIITLTNGVSVLVDTIVSLETKATIYLYSTDEFIIDTENYLISEFGKIVDENVTVFNKETIDINFGKKLNYVYNNVITMFTNKKYKRHETSVPMTYTEDVYRTYDNGLIIDPNVSPSGRVTLNLELLHRKGDIVYDIDGNIVYKYKVNDIMYDEFGNKIVDELAGIKRIVSILMFEYEFKLAETETYKNYMEIVMSNLYSMMYTDMEDLNSYTIEKTKIMYKSFRSVAEVPVIVNNVVYLLPWLVRPKVVLVIESNSTVLDSKIIEDYKATCGKIISKHLNDNKIYLREIKDEIMTTIGNKVVGVKLTGIEEKNSEVILTTDDNRFTINKKLVATEANQLTVKYDLDLTIEYV